MTKQEEFLLLVQSAALANAINRSLVENVASVRHEISATGVMFIMQEALRASRMIPEDLDSMEAANDFGRYMIGVDGARGDHCPAWFARNRSEAL